MSNTPFDTITAAHLSRYDRRRRALVTARGLCWTICVATGLLLACVLLDWLVVLPDPLRWSISVTCYLVASSVVFVLCLRPLMRAVDYRKIAIQMERAEPTLQNRLLSAVELRAAEGASAGSPQLRKISQSKVADAIQAVDIRRLLPLSRLKGSGQYALLAMSLLAVSMLLPGSDFPLRFARVLMPGANLGRTSLTHLAIKSPSPASGPVPAEETTAVTAIVSGKPPANVHLQYRGNGNDERQAMHAQDGHQYAINLPVGSEPIEYRLQAGNSVTPWHTLVPKQRPTITTFQKTIRHPTYAELEDSRLTNANGDFEAIEGSTVEIEWIASAPLSSAQLSVRWDDGVPEPWPLEQLESNRFRLSLPINGSGSYEIALVDAETGFDNPFLPAYRIRSIEDLPPQIEMADSSGTPILLAANDLLPFEMKVRDELQLAMVGYEIAINGNEWESTPLDLPDESTIDNRAFGDGVALNSSRSLTLSHQLDLLPHNLDVGDSVRLRGIAIDRKGQTGQTSVLDIVIDSSHYDPGTRDAVLNRLSWAAAVKEWAMVVQKASETTIEELDSLLADIPEDRVPIAGNIDTRSLKAAVEQSEQAIDESIGQLPNTKDPIAAAQLEHVGRMVDVVQADLQESIILLNSELPPPQDSQVAKQRKQSLHQAADHARRTEEYVSHFIGFDLTLAYTAEVYGLIGLLDSFQPESAADSPWRRLYRFSTVTFNRLKAFDTFVAETANHLPARSQNITTALRKWLGDRLHPLNQILQETTENDPGGEEDALRKLLVNLRRELGDKTNTGSQDRQLHTKTVGGLRDLDRRSGALHPEIAFLGDKLQQVAKAEQAVLASKDAAEIERTEAERTRVNVVAKWFANDLPVRLRRWATLHQLRPDADARYAVDAGLASRAIESVLRLPAGSSDLQNTEQEHPTSDEVLKRIAGDYQILEAGHRLTQALEHLEQLVQSERWNRNHIVRRFELPLQWDRHLQAVEDAAAALRAAKIDAQIYSPVHRSRWETPQNIISQAMSERRSNRKADLPVFRQMQDIHDKLASPHGQLQPVMEAARQRIAAYVASIPQLAEDAADSLQRVAASQSASEPSDSPDDSPSPDDTPAESDSMVKGPQSDEAAAEAFQERMQRLTAALVEHANVADTSTFDGIQQARDADVAVDVLEASHDVLQRAQADAAAQRAKAKGQGLASSPELQRTEEELAKAQQRTLDLLKTVQQHFAGGAESDQQQQRNAAETDERLLAALREAGLQRESDERFEAIEQFVEASKKTPQELLQELNAALQRNPEMQNALSDIARSAVEGVRQTLSNSANEQATMQRGIESADSDFRHTKKPLVQAFKELADRSSEIERTLVQQAERAASRGEIPAIVQQIRQQRTQLGEIAATARSLKDDALMADLQQTAGQVAKSLGDVARQIKAASDEAASKQETAAEVDESKRRNLAKSLQDENRRMRESRIRDAQNRLRTVQREVVNAEKKLHTRESNLKQIESQVRQTEQKVKQNPDNTRHKRTLAQMVQQRQQTQQQVDDAKADEQAAKEKRGRYETDVAAAKATPQPELKAANPAAQSARELAAHAAELADQFRQTIRQAADTAETTAAPTPPENHLQNAEGQQQMVQQQVEDAARDLARAARHERRLKKQTPAEKLYAHARKIAQTARSEVLTAEKRMEAARQAAHQRQQATEADEADPADQGRQDQSEAESIARQTAVAARDALRQSEQALRQREQEMGSLVGAADTEGASPENAASSDGQAGASDAQAGSPDAQASGPAGQGSPGESPPEQNPTASGVQDSELLAQTLDQLDQQLAASGEQQSSGQPESSGLPSSFASRLESEARARGRQMAQQRTAGQEAPQAPSEQPSDSTSGLVSNAAGPGMSAGATEKLQRADRRGDNAWGALETLSIEDAADSRTDSLNRAYRSQLEAYFRVLAERSRNKSSSAEGL